jgi:hypothetical protein
MDIVRNLPVAIDDHWKSLDRYSDPHCHEWQHGAHIDSLPVEANTPYLPCVVQKRKTPSSV